MGAAARPPHFKNQGTVTEAVPDTVGVKTDFAVTVSWVFVSSLPTVSNPLLEMIVESEFPFTLHSTSCGAKPSVVTLAENCALCPFATVVADGESVIFVTLEVCGFRITAFAKGEMPKDFHV